MTDELCKVEGCSYPLMRSKDGSVSFCTKHDELPNAPNASAKKPEQKSQSRTPSVPVVADEFQIRRERREQSSKASQLIGQKMLQRWAMLNEQCPSESCYAVNIYIQVNFICYIHIKTHSVYLLLDPFGP
jgi:uncharacterized Zn finger protein (UPF0148 family)